MPLYTCRMNRRQFLIASGATAHAFAAAENTQATVLYGDRATRLDRVRTQAADLWVRAADLPRINEVEVKPQGACRADMCIPIPRTLKNGEWFNLTGFASRLRQTFLHEAGVWSFGEIPVVRGDFYRTRNAPDFAVPDRAGKVVHLSDFRGRKVLVVTWASW